ncbi:hypothetical protein [Xanthomonas albilineans]|uniref:hypothetical protein n=1 Tax=Xanthomonas albilineans TaxID=29447 RepID=UPI000A8A63C7|nr:hypothetical protein [Xanthomonas albilineans]
MFQVVAKCSAGSTYVADFSNNALYNACSYIDVNDVKPYTRTPAVQYNAVNQDYQRVFNDYHQVYINNGRSLGYTAYLHGTLSVSSSQDYFMSRYVSIFLDSLISTAQAQSSSSDNGYINAYDTVVSVQANQNVINRLTSQAFSAPSLSEANPGFGPGLVGAIAQLENAFNSSLINFSNFNATYIVEFPDGSQRTYRVDFQAHSYAAVPGTARDSHGNIIAENKAMVSNGSSIARYNFTGDPGYDRTNFIHLAQGFGAQGDFSQAMNWAGAECFWDGTTLSCSESR